MGEIKTTLVRVSNLNAMEGGGNFSRLIRELSKAQPTQLTSPVKTALVPTLKTSRTQTFSFQLTRKMFRCITETSCCFSTWWNSSVSFH